MTLRKKVSLKNFTTMRIGGPASFFVTVKNEFDLTEARTYAGKHKLKWSVVGEGSNIIASDRGYNGLLIRNKIKKFERRGDIVIVGAGNNLLKTINVLNALGLSGLERMAGIPGTVGGAIYGSAGAYGQEIKDRIVSVKVWDGRKFRNFSRMQCNFGYRDSIFKKKKNWVIIEITLQMKQGNPKKLMQGSGEIIKLRQKKYRPGLKCPGSFFKNLLVNELSRSQLSKIDRSKIVYQKLPTGYLLEEVGAKGMREGSIKVANHHANLIFNPNGGKAADIARLARKLKRLVKKRFGIKIEEEVQYLGF